MVIWARRHYEALGTPARRLTVVYVGVFGAHRFHSLDSRHGPLLAPSSVSRQNISHVYPFLGQMVYFRVLDRVRVFRSSGLPVVSLDCTDGNEQKDFEMVERVSWHRVGIGDSNYSDFSVNQPNTGLDVTRYPNSLTCPASQYARSVEILQRRSLESFQNRERFRVKSLQIR